MTLFQENLKKILKKKRRKRKKQPRSSKNNKKFVSLLETIFKLFVYWSFRFSRNFKLLSFGEEAEEDEEETIEVNKKFAGKGKSAHDTLADPKLSAQTAVEVTKAEESHEEDEDSDEVTEVDKKGMTDRIKNKLLSKKEKVIEVEEEEEDYLGKADKEAKKKKL